MPRNTFYSNKQIKQMLKDCSDSMTFDEIPFRAIEQRLKLILKELELRKTEGQPPQ